MSDTVKMNADIEYCLQRETEERRAESGAESIYVREAHFEMAERYADQAWSLTEALYALERDARPKSPSIQPISL